MGQNSGGPYYCQPVIHLWNVCFPLPDLESAGLWSRFPKEHVGDTLCSPELETEHSTRPLWVPCASR